MRKSAKRKLIIVTVIVLLLLSLLIILNIRKKMLEKQARFDALNIPQADPSYLYTDTSIAKVDTMSTILALQDSMNTYYKYLNEENSSALAGIINKEYISENGLNENNLVSTLKNNQQNKAFYVTDAYYKEISFDHEYKYWVFGKSYTTDYKNVETEQFIVNLDFFNFTFKITPVGKKTEEEFNSYMNNVIHSDNGDTVVAENNVTSIEKNNYNGFTLSKGNDVLKNTIEIYAKYYYFLERTNPRLAYELLEDNYKNKKFGSYENFVKSNIVWANVDIEYIKQTTENGKNLFLGIDKRGTYYIFYETAPMDYKVILDSYTIPLEETANKYSESTDEEKVMMCLECIKEMINIRDVQSYLSRMNESFKQNNNINEETLKSYLSSKFYSTNKFEYESYKISGSSYIVTVRVTDANDNNNSFTINYVVKLNNDLTDFEFSYEL